MNTDHIPSFGETELPSRLTATLMRQAKGSLASQNNRYADARQDQELHEVDDMSRTVLEGLYAEQRGTIDTLHKHMYKIDNLAVERAAVESQLLKEQQELDDAEARLIAERQRIKSLAERAIKYAPTRREELEKQAENHLAEINEQYTGRIDDLKPRIAALANRLYTLERIYNPMRDSETWPLPTVINDPELAALVNPVEDEAAEFVSEDETPEVEIIDELPADLIELPSSERAFETHEFYGREASASELVAEFFIQNAETVFLPEQISDHIYDPAIFAAMPDEMVAESRRHRIRRLLNGDSSKVKSALEQKGLKLQYGWRHFLHHETKKAVQPKRRIFRAVQITEGADIPATFPDEEVTVLSENETANPAPIVPKFVQVQMREKHVKEAITPGEFNKDEVFGLLASMMEKGILPDQPYGTKLVATLRTIMPRSHALSEEFSEQYDRLRKELGRFKSHEEIRASQLVLGAIGVPDRIRKRDKHYKKHESALQNLLVEFYGSDEVDSDQLAD